MLNQYKNLIFLIFIFFSFLLSDNYSLPENLKLELIQKKFNKPIFINTPFKGSDTLFVTEQNGLIRILINKKIAKTPFLNIADRVHQTKMPGDERGLLGFAFHPEYLDNGKIYVNYVNSEGNTTISEFTKFISRKLSVDPSSEKILMIIEQPYSNHNGGHMEFGPDGYLYIAVGDGGSAGDPHGNAQNYNTLLGSILRIDVNTEKKYLVPDTNPFINKEGLDEIWAYGLRNPWRFSIDEQTSLIFIADVGQNNWEELNIVKINEGGYNFGWNILEGSHCYLDNKCNGNDMVLPEYEYPNDANYFKTILGIKQKRDVHGCSITGGYLYKGLEIPEIKNHYFFADYCTGKILSVKYDTLEEYDWTEMLMKTISSKKIYISSFGLDGNNEIYIVDHGGEIYKISKNN